MKYSRVFLIEPDYPKSTYPNLTWPLGLGYIARSLEKAGIDYQAFDMRLSNKKRLLYQQISESQPDLIGISIGTSKYKYHYAFIKAIKERFPGLPIVAGGPHVSTFKQKLLLQCPQIDYGVSGEGEETIVELCQGKDPAQIKGLLYRDNAQIIYTGDRKRISDLDSIPFPTFNGFEIEKYDTTSMNILSSRGCPYQCIFCPMKVVIGRQWFARSPQGLVDEIEYWYNRNYRIFNIWDDTFNLDRNRIFGICDELERRNINIELNVPNGMRADMADRELLSRMKKTGFRHISFGVEAGNNKVLSNIKKGETIEQINRAVKNACEVGFNVTLFFLIGSPGENKQDIEDSFRLAEAYPIIGAKFFNLIPFPTTDLYEWVAGNKYFALLPDQYLNGNMHRSSTPAFFTPELSLKQRKKFYRRGLKLDNKLWKKYLFRYHRQGFTGPAMLANAAAYITSNNSFQFLLNSKIIQSLKGKIKRNIRFRQIYNQ